MFKKIATALVGKYSSRLRFPQLFGAVAVLFFLDLLIPDLVPFTDEILLGLLTLLLGSLQKPVAANQEDELDKPPMKDITPPGEGTG
jgi:hypothetical protein